ncbi:MAG: peptidoglycan editing factor PgeF [Oligoflexales bacterium]
MQSWEYLDKSHFISLQDLPKFHNIRLNFYGKGHCFSPKNKLHQVHSNRHLCVNEQSTEHLMGDAFSTEQNHCELAIRTADCLPILIWDQHRIGGIHAGWKGLASGVIQNTLSSFKKSQLKVVIGPSIGPCCFEIGPEVIESFKMQFSSEDFFLASTKGINDRWHLDLNQLALFIFKEYEVPPSSIYTIRECTHHNKKWNSYRRNGANTQHNWSTITRTSS